MWAGGAWEAPNLPTVLCEWMLFLQTGPVDEETFLKAAVEGRMKVIDKYLADGGSADTCDEVMAPSGARLPFRTTTIPGSGPGSAPFLGSFENTHGCSWG